MWRVPTILLAFGAIGAALAIWCSETTASIFPAIRGNLFAGFLTLGGFLLSLQTFIVVNLREKFYGHDLYQKRFDRWRKDNPHSKDGRYTPLRNLSTFLVWSVVCCLSNSVLQVTLGLVPSIYAQAACLGGSAGSIALVFRSWWAIRESLHNYFDALDELERERIEELKKITAGG